MVKKFGYAVKFQQWLRTLDPAAEVTVGFQTLPAKLWEEVGSYRGFDLIAFTFRYGTGGYQAYLRDPLTRKPLRFRQFAPLARRPISKEALSGMGPEKPRKVQGKGGTEQWTPTTR